MPHGLLALNFQRGDRLIHAEDRSEWVIMDLAAVALRGITVGLYPTNPAAEVVYTLNDCGSKIHIVEDQEQADKVIDLPASDFPLIEKIVYIEPRGIRRSTDERLLSWDDFIALGREHRAANAGAVDASIDSAESSDVMTLVYTSGTTGPPKGAMITNENAQFGIDVILRTPERIRGGKLPGPSDSVLTCRFATLPSASSRRGIWRVRVSCSTSSNRPKRSMPTFADPANTVRRGAARLGRSSRQSLSKGVTRAG
ncbi:MAG: AMP-binding protein [Acidimicrobiales bacterium]